MKASTAEKDLMLGAWDLLHDLGENFVCVDVLRFRLEIEDDAMAQRGEDDFCDILIADMDSSVGQCVAFSS